MTPRSLILNPRQSALHTTGNGKITMTPMSPILNPGGVLSMPQGTGLKFY